MADVQADPVCRRLDKLIRNRNILKHQIFYKYLHNMTQTHYDTKNPYDKDMIEFFGCFVHHSGESTNNIVRGLVGFGNRQSSLKEIRMNLGGPGIEIFR